MTKSIAVVVFVVFVVVVVAATWYKVLRFDGFTNFANVVLFFKVSEN